MKEANKISNLILILGFVLLIILPGINGLFGLISFEKKDENRNFSNELKFSLDHLDPFPDDFERFWNDNFSFRSPLLDLYHSLQYHIFKESPHPEKTIIGLDGWCFLKEKQIEVYQGKWNPNEEKLEMLKTEWTLRSKYFDSLKIPVLWVIAPVKHNIYSEKLPFRYRIKKDKTRGQIVGEFMEKSFPGLVYEPTADLIERKKKEKLYYQLDNHWNKKAGNFISEKIIQILMDRNPELGLKPLHKFEWEKVQLRQGFHWKVLGIDSISESDFEPKKEGILAYPSAQHGFPITKGFKHKGWFEWPFKNPKAKNKLKALVIRDSFGNQLTWFLPDAFYETVFIWDNWRYQLNEHIIEAYQPDVVIFLSTEVRFENMIKDYSY